MKSLRLVLMAMLLALPFAAMANAQVAVGVGVGPEVVPAPYAYGPPACDWGYYPYSPYSCAPYGYYGPTWFSGGIFIGAGPWYGWGCGGGYRGGVAPRAFNGGGHASGGFSGGARGGFSGGGGFHGGGGGGFHGGGGGGHR
jgi:hypothetical protein